MQNSKKIAFQGVEGANSDLACRKFYPNYHTISCGNFSDVFSLVAEGEVDYGMIPLENSYAGRVSEIHNLLQNSNVSIVAEHFFKIELHLAGIKDSSLEEIKVAYSHPQALMQCRNNLLKANIKGEEYYNTAAAAKLVMEQDKTNQAALCSKVAADLYGLKILKENMQDADDNVTIFIVIAKKAIDPDPKNGKIITTMICTVRNIPGSLYKALGGFATNGVNMLKLESYIPGGISRQAKFFISIEGHPSDKNVAQALEEVGFFSKSVKVLGVYYADKSRYEE